MRISEKELDDLVEDRCLDSQTCKRCRALLDLRDLRALCRTLVEKEHTVGCGCLFDQVEAIKQHLEGK